MSTYKVFAETYDHRLIVLFILLAILGSYAGLDFGARMSMATGPRKTVWICAGSLISGVYLLGLHYICLGAFHPFLPVQYDWPTALVSLVASVIASLVVFLVLIQGWQSHSKTLIGSICAGILYAFMHFAFLDSIRIHAERTFSPRLIVLSFLCVTGVSFLVINTSRAYKDCLIHIDCKKCLNAICVGSALSVAYYVGMRAVYFISTNTFNASTAHAVSISGSHLVSIGATLLFLQLVMIFVSTISRQAALHAHEIANDHIRIEQFAGGIAHDFNNLLSTVIGNLDYIEQQIEHKSLCADRIRSVRDASLHGIDLTQRLLAFHGKQHSLQEHLDLNLAIKNVLTLAAPALGSEITISTQLSSSIPGVLTDAAGLQSALLNLIVNARDAMPNGGQLIITSEIRNLCESGIDRDRLSLGAGRYAYVSITDTGHGMTENVLNKAFEPFFTTKSQGKGTGLGLATVSAFFKQSNGAIRIYSLPEKGTSVAFYLPISIGIDRSLESSPCENLLAIA